MTQPETYEQLSSSPRRWALMALLVVGMVVCYAHRNALSVASPFMIQELNLSPTVMGILLSAFFWSYAVLQIPAGWAVDRFGVKRAYACGFIIWSFASVLTGFATGIAALVFLRMLLGIGQSIAFPASARAVANWFQNKERGLVTGGYLAGVRYGQALIAAVGAYLLISYSWKFFFLVTGIVPLLWLIPWYWMAGANEDERHATPRVEQDAWPKRSGAFAENAALLRDRTVFGIFLGFFAYDYAWFVYTTWLPGYLMLERKFTATEMGIYSAAPFLIMSIIILLSGALSDLLIRRGLEEMFVRKAFIVVGMLIGCLIVPAGIVEDKMTSVWLLTISLCGLGICSPNTWTLTQAVCPKNKVGTVTGIQNFGGNLGGVIAPALTGFIATETQSFSLAMSITGGILIIGIASYIFLVGRSSVFDEAGPEISATSR
jgi:MFS transporter, ACS family, D-galactonate transporter